MEEPNADNYLQNDILKDQPSFLLWWIFKTRIVIYYSSNTVPAEIKICFILNLTSINLFYSTLEYSRHFRSPLIRPMPRHMLLPNKGLIHVNSIQTKGQLAESPGQVQEHSQME